MTEACIMENRQAGASGAPPVGPQSALHPRMLGATEEFPIGLHPAGESGTVVSFFHPGPVSREMFETLSLLASRSDRWAVIRAALDQADSGSCEITPEMVEAGYQALCSSGIADEYLEADTLTVEKIYRAMWRHRPSGPEEKPKTRLPSAA